MQYRPLTLPALVVATSTLLYAPAAHADGDNKTLIPNNKRLNDGVVANVYTMQQAGCTNDVKINPQRQLAAQRHTKDVLNNRNLDGDIGSDGSTPRAARTRLASTVRPRKRWRSTNPSQSAATI